MPWVVGIDEAGYGPNLGPLVQAAVALHLPDADPAGWDTLRPVVRRAHEKDDGRLLIDDSKKVYTRGGLAALERGVLSILAPDADDLMYLTSAMLMHPCIGPLFEEAWYVRDEPLPLVVNKDDIIWPEAIGFTPAHVNLVQPVTFNRIVDAHGSKAAVLSQGIIDLLQYLLDGKGTSGPIHITCDKLGGRNFYAAVVQAAFPDGWVVTERESADESRYRVELLDRPVSVTFRPRADSDSVAVALASMLCKYLREVCMRQFNRFWTRHVPGITPTAGYPLDAKRFYDEIRPAMAKLGLTEDQVWRKR